MEVKKITKEECFHRLNYIPTTLRLVQIKLCINIATTFLLLLASIRLKKYFILVDYKFFYDIS